MPFLTNPTSWIILLTVIISLLAWKNAALMSRLIFYPPAVQHGQVDRFVTHGFVHGDSMHLLFNMFTMYSFGYAMLDRSGRTLPDIFNSKLPVIGFLLFYMVALVVAVIPTYLKHKNNPNYATLGASGAVTAVLFAFVLFNPWSTLLFFVIPVPAIVFAVGYVAYSIYADHRGSGNTNHSAHLWGGAFGIMATVAVEPSVVVRFASALMHPRFLGMGG